MVYSTVNKHQFSKNNFPTFSLPTSNQILHYLDQLNTSKSSEIALTISIIFMMQNYQCGTLMGPVQDRQQGKTAMSTSDQRQYTKTHSEVDRTYWFSVKHGHGITNHKVWLGISKTIPRWCSHLESQVWTISVENISNCSMQILPLHRIHRFTALLFFSHFCLFFESKLSIMFLLFHGIIQSSLFYLIWKYVPLLSKFHKRSLPS